MAFFRGAFFFKSVASLDDVPTSGGEIAFAGRSNAGKSSAINTLVRNRLAFVSKTPGRTQVINYYSLGAERFMVDLPGYGYSKVPDAIREPWEKLLGGYLQTRGPLRGLALIMDARHPLTELDQRMLGWFCPTGRPVHVLLTKADKLSREAAQKILGQVAKEIAVLAPNASVQLFSSLKKSGIEEATAVFQRWLDPSVSEFLESGRMEAPPDGIRGPENKPPGLKGKSARGKMP